MAIKDKNTLTSDKNAAITTNGAGDITASVDRDVRQDIIDSYLNLSATQPEQNVQAPANFTGGIKKNGTDILAASSIAIVESLADIPSALEENTRYILQTDITLNNPITGAEGAIIDISLGELSIDSSDPLLTIDGVNMLISGNQGLNNNGSGPGVLLSNTGSLTTYGANILSTSGQGVLADSTANFEIFSYLNSHYVGGTNGLEIEAGGTVSTLIQDTSDFIGTSKGFLLDGDVGLWNVATGTCQGTTSNGLDINGNITVGWQPVNLQIVSGNGVSGSDAADLTGSIIEGISASGGAFVSLAPGFSSLKGDTSSANINNEANFSETAFVTIVPTDPELDGITIGDLRYDFSKCPNLENSAILGCVGLDSPTTTTISVISTPVKMDGATSECSIIERCQQSDNNELEYIGIRSTKARVTATVSGTKQGGGGAELFNVYIYRDNVGGPFVEIPDATLPIDVDNRGRFVVASSLIVAQPNEKFQIWISNEENVDNFNAEFYKLELQGF